MSDVGGRLYISPSKKLLHHSFGVQLHTKHQSYVPATLHVIIIVFTSLIGGEDYIDFTTSLSLNVGDIQKCIGIIIQEDQKPEADESFLVELEGLEKAMHTEVIISDDDGMT